MKLILTTYSGIQTYEDVCTLDGFQEGNYDQYQITFFNPQKPEVLLDKSEVLLIQVVN